MRRPERAMGVAVWRLVLGRHVAGPSFFPQLLHLFFPPPPPSKRGLEKIENKIFYD